MGALYVRNGLKIGSLLVGGGQERGKRAGTENVASIVGLGCAITEATKDIEAKNKHLKELRETIKQRTLIVYSAHGSHFAFSNELPDSATEYGDLVYYTDFSGGVTTGTRKNQGRIGTASRPLRKQGGIKHGLHK